MWLIRYLIEFETGRNGFLQFSQFFIDGFAEFDIVRPRIHGDGDTDGRFAFVVELRVARVLIGHGHVRHIAETQCLIIDAYRHVPYRLRAVEETVYAKVHIIRICRNRTGRNHHALLFQGGQKLLCAHLIGCELILVDGDVQRLLLYADETDFLYIRYG